MNNPLVRITQPIDTTSIALIGLYCRSARRSTGSTGGRMALASGRHLRDHADWRIRSPEDKR
jgi:hypothetical protein